MSQLINEMERPYIYGDYMTNDSPTNVIQMPSTFYDRGKRDEVIPDGEYFLRMIQHPHQPGFLYEIWQFTTAMGFVKICDFKDPIEAIGYLGKRTISNPSQIYNSIKSILSYFFESHTDEESFEYVRDKAWFFGDDIQNLSTMIMAELLTTDQFQKFMNWFKQIWNSDNSTKHPIDNHGNVVNGIKQYGFYGYSLYVNIYYILYKGGDAIIQNSEPTEFFKLMSSKVDDIIMKIMEEYDKSLDKLSL